MSVHEFARRDEMKARRMSQEQIRAAMARYGYRPMTREEVAEEKAIIERLREKPGRKA